MHNTDNLILNLLNGYKIKAFPNDLISKEIIKHGIYEKNLFLFLKSILGNDKTSNCIDIALQAWEKLHQQYPELSLRMVFRGPKSAVYIKRAKLPRVIASPLIDDPREYYNKARLVIAPSAYESWGNIITESLALGIPVVASAQVPSSEVIQSQEHGQTFNRTGKNDAIALTNAIRETLQTCSTDINTMQSRHQHIVYFQSQHLTSTKWLCSIAEQPLKIK